MKKKFKEACEKAESFLHQKALLTLSKAEFSFFNFINSDGKFSLTINLVFHIVIYDKLCSVHWSMISVCPVTFMDATPHKTTWQILFKLCVFICSWSYCATNLVRQILQELWDFCTLNFFGVAGDIYVRVAYIDLM